MIVWKCRVSYRDVEGALHTVEVHAQTMHEAAVYAIREFRDLDCEPDESRELEIEVFRQPIVHSVRLERFYAWLSSSGSPKETVEKRQLRDYLERKRPAPE